MGGEGLGCMRKKKHLSNRDLLFESTEEDWGFKKK